MKKKELFKDEVIRERAKGGVLFFPWMARAFGFKRGFVVCQLFCEFALNDYEEWFESPDEYMKKIKLTTYIIKKTKEDLVKKGILEVKKRKGASDLLKLDVEKLAALKGEED